MASRRPEDLVSSTHALYLEWKKGMEEADIDFLLTCTKRTMAEQEALWAYGRTKPGPKRTWTLNSRHLLGKAWDFVIMVGGKPDWKVAHPELWKKAVSIGLALGLHQAVNKKGRVLELAHLEE